MKSCGIAFKRYISNHEVEKVRRLREYIEDCECDYPFFLISLDTCKEMEPEMFDEVIIMKRNFGRSRLTYQKLIVGNNILLIKHIHENYSITFQNYWRKEMLKYISYECFLYIAKNNDIERDIYVYILKRTRDSRIMRYILENHNYIKQQYRSRRGPSIFSPKDVIEIRRNHPKCFKVLTNYGLSRNLGNFADISDAITNHAFDYISEHLNDFLSINNENIKLLVNTSISCNNIEIFSLVIKRLVGPDDDQCRINIICLDFIGYISNNDDWLDELRWFITKYEDKIIFENLLYGVMMNKIMKNRSNIFNGLHDQDLNDN